MNDQHGPQKKQTLFANLTGKYNQVHFFVKVVFTTLVSLVFSFVVTFLWRSTSKGWSGIEWGDALAMDDLQFVSTAVCFGVGIVLAYSSEHRQEQKRLFNRLQAYDNGRSLVFVAPDKGAYDDDHVIDLVNRLRQFSPSTPKHDRLIAIDASPPIEWWSKSMLSYLAVQASWAAGHLVGHADNKPKSVARIFLMDKSTMRGSLASRLIQLHVLLGFDTYVMRIDLFHDFFQAHKGEYGIEHGEYIQGPFEFSIWHNPSTGIADLANQGYYSYWSTTLPYDRRNEDLPIAVLQANGTYADGTLGEQDIQWRDFASIDAMERCIAMFDELTREKDVPMLKASEVAAKFKARLRAHREVPHIVHLDVSTPSDMDLRLKMMPEQYERAGA